MKHLLIEITCILGVNHTSKVSSLHFTGILGVIPASNSLKKCFTGFNF